MRNRSASSTLAKLTKAVKIVGIDPANGFIKCARAQINDPCVTIEIGDAQALPCNEGSFDTSMALLIVNFVPDAPKAMKEMCRVTKSGGIVATTIVG